MYLQNQDVDYEKACDEKFDSTEKIIIFAFRLFVMLIAILSCLFVIITILKSPKKKFWPFKFLLIQVISELIDLTLAIIFSVNSPCYYQLCIYVGYIMHSNWLASLEMLCLQCFTYFCMLKIEYIFHIIRINQNKIIVIIYILPYILLSFILPNGFGPSGWFLKDGNFYYIFCGFVQSNTLLIFWIIPVSILFTLDIAFSTTLQWYCNFLCNQRELAFSAKRIKSLIWLPSIYFFAWIINFIVRSFDPPPNQQDNQLKKRSLFVYILYQIVNLGFELHLLVGAFCFYIIYNGFLNIDDIWKKLLRCKRKKTETLQSFHELSYNDDQ